MWRRDVYTRIHPDNAAWIGVDCVLHWRKRMTPLAFLFGLISQAQAVPLQLTQQGRLMDANGSAITGYHDLSFRIYDDYIAGFTLWEETLNVNFNNGYYSAILGTDMSNNPLDDAILNQYPIYMEVEIDSNGPMSPRQPIYSNAYSRIAGWPRVSMVATCLPLRSALGVRWSSIPTAPGWGRPWR